MTSLQERLFAMQDKQYAAFQAKLTPGVPVESFIGIRVPVLRKFAKEFTKEAECKDFLQQLPHEYYDENMLHGLLISEVKDYEECIRLTDRFLPFVDNWAVCDIMSPKVFAKHKKELLAKIKTWSKSSHVYTCRFGIETLMSHYLDKDFKAEYLEIPASVRSEEYYVKMMVAWFFATALAKQWDATIPYIEQNRLAPWTHNKTIQKAIESYRITPEQKEYLRTLKIKIIMTQDTSTYYVWIGGSCDYGHKERAGGAAVVIEHNGNIISRDVISDLHTTEFRMMLTLMIKVMQEIPGGSDILFLTNAAYIQNFDKTPTAKSANPDLIIQCIEEKKRHNSVGVKIVQYHKSPLLIETHDRATEAMAKTRKQFHQKNK